MDRNLVQGILADIEILRGILPQQLAAIAGQCWSLEAKRGQDVVTKGSRVPGLFAVASGTIKLALRLGESGQRVVRLVQAGETFGEATALLGRNANFQAAAVTACRLVVVPAASVFGLLEREPRGARQVIFTLARRNLELLDEIESSSMRRTAERLAAYLASLVDPAQGNGGAHKVRLPATKTLIASRLDMKKETLSRLLGQLARQGLIEVAGSDITLLDPQRLGRLAARASPLALEGDLAP